MKEKKTVTRMQNRYIKDKETLNKARNRRRVALARRLAVLLVAVAVVFFCSLCALHEANDAFAR